MAITNIYINQLIPESLKLHGKTGGNVRFIEILKRLEQSGAVNVSVRSTRCIAKNLAENGLNAKYETIGSSLKFSNYVDLCLKSFFLIIRHAPLFFIAKSRNAGEKNVVYATSDLFWEVIPAYISKKRNMDVEWVQVIHHIYTGWRKRPGSRAVNFFGEYLQKFSFFLIRQKADKIILVNQLVKSSLIKKGFQEKKIYVSSNGIDFGYFDKLEKGECSYDGVFLGRLNISKGICDLIAIWKKVAEVMPDARLAVIGGGEVSVKNSLQKKINEAGLSGNIEIMGFLEDRKAHGILKSGKIFVFPSHEEGWGIAIAEAIASGLPAVCWDLPVYSGVFESAIVRVEKYDIDQFSKKIAGLLENGLLRKKISDNGKNFIRKYSWDEVSRRELEIINI
jgi:glycosyltransferase involved in cell wall biosynthesis